ncbi:MAG: 4Fe-4S binding protein [Patescibacteria group bacterium]|nr:4Fe-4S binding protein [Patescibacteria group bacterium]
MADNNKFTPVVNDNCKNCGICVEFCPKGVLKMENGKLKVTNPEECIGCKICEKMCPDLAIEVKKKDHV